ncbi:hypothetical protein N825_27860 [Skermanella stibiiresistens SB22]|uniref:VanZ-like domain-containing protein n=1 Tax=Skermanella stibiiresistens SB22 TaxID=1385369 RepID=W9HCA4_9PROT|nr:VanZ family protein [Skermanella stibiiresistens]EWY41513.1 hypothetical protein N825_27860 [Skermanella stibiiresistens SB22]
MLVALYVNTFEIWGLLVAATGARNAALVPFAVLGVAVTVAIMLGWRIRRSGTAGIDLGALAGALALIALGLLITDPAYPAKRIHVPQYLLLSLVLRRALSDHVGGWALTVATALLTALFGIHDELLQGLHPHRTYGLRDILVNGVSAAAGAALARGIGLWPGPDRPFAVDAKLVTAGVALALAVAFPMVTLVAYRNAMPPPWLGVPVLAVSVLLLIGWGIPRPADPASRRLAAVFAWTALPLALYPVIPHVTPLVFN